MHDGMPNDPIQGQGQGHDCLKATQEESTVSPARDYFFSFSSLLSPHGMRRHIVYCFVHVSITASTKSTRLGKLIERALLYIRAKRVELSPMQSPCGAKILKGVKNCNAFLVHPLAERTEILHDEGHLCATGHLLFW